MKCLKYILLLFIASVCATSCEDMLTPENDRNTANFAQDSMYSYWGILSNVQKIAARNVIIGESRGDLVEPTSFISDSVNHIAQYSEKAENGTSALLNVADYYKVINMCNFYIHKVDTARTIYNRQVMLREYAQVQFLRAWVYMKLVENYGSVPFITEPVEETNTKIENNEGIFVDRFTLREKLYEAGLERALSIEKNEGRPRYGDYNTGAVTIPNLTTLFYGELVAADLYLLGAQSTADYEKAAELYFDYLSKTAINYSQLAYGRNDIGYSRRGGAGSENYQFYESSYRSAFTTYAFSHNITQIPLAANTVFGNVVTDVSSVYGFTPIIRQSTNATSDSTASTSGYISLMADYRARQLGPSASVLSLGESQTFVRRGDKRGTYTTIPTLGDGRAVALAPFVETEKGNMRFIFKANPFSANGDNFHPVSGTSLGVSFHYAIPVYRPEMVMLRYAEAINRAGYPGHAFALLRTGLSNDLLSRATRVERIASIDTVAPGATFASGDINASADTVFDTTRVYSWDAVTSTNRPGGDSINYISIHELLRAKGKPYLAYASFPTLWLPSIHSRGSGQPLPNVPDSLYSYRDLTMKKLEQEQARLAAYGENLGGSIAAHNFVRSIPASADTAVVITPEEADPVMINMVEELLADEMAMELAYEGVRFADLTRIAEHKNHAGLVNGTNWFAWKVARRAEALKPYENLLKKDETLYNKLTDKNNWYLKLPRYN